MQQHEPQAPAPPTHQLAGQEEQAAAPLSVLQNWPAGQKPAVQAGVPQAGVPAQPGRQEAQVVAEEQEAHVAPQDAHAGVPPTTEQNWPAGHVPQLGWLQSVPFQPDLQDWQLPELVQVRLRGKVG